MAVPLESVPPVPETRSDRWVRSITLQAALKYVPAATAIGVPLSFILAHTYAVGYASHFGIPRDFVHVGPQAAVTPFLMLLFLLLALPLIGDIQRHGVTGTLKGYGSALRILFFVFGIGLYMVELRRGELSPLLALCSTLLVYVILWWVPPFIAWAARWIAKGLGMALGSVGHSIRRPLEVVFNHFFRSIPAVSLPELLTFGKLMLIPLVAMAAFALPAGLGVLAAETQEEFPVIVGAAQQSEKQAIVAVYGDKAFLARVEGHSIRAVIVKQAADLKDVELRNERLGELRLAK